MTSKRGGTADWDRRRVHAATAFIKARLDADFAGTGLPAIEFRVDRGWSTGRTTAGGDRGIGAAADGVIVVCGGHEFPLGLQDGVEVACSDAANALQDDLMDELSRPWPEVSDRAGRFIGVLSPANHAQVAHWTLNGSPLCAVGHLRPACEAAGLTIKDAG